MKKLMHCKFVSLVYFVLCFTKRLCANDVITCGGFVESRVKIPYDKIQVQLLNSNGNIKYQTPCYAKNGYYMVPIYDHGEYFLTLSTPKNWIFEPAELKLRIDGENDECSKQINLNFKFVGVQVTGQVDSIGCDHGPAGVIVKLSPTTTRTSDDVSGDYHGQEQGQTVTDAQGRFQFQSIGLGKYDLAVSRDGWDISTTHKTVTITDSGVDFGKITVNGYRTQGTILSQGEPVAGVVTFLFSISGDSSSPRLSSSKINCGDGDGSLSSGAGGDSDWSDESKDALCHTVSTKNGQFSFHNLPCGSYEVVPIYKSGKTRFDVTPARVVVNVNHADVIIEESFEVTGFSVNGRVLRGKNSESGLSGAAVLLNGKVVGETSSSGKYTLENIEVSGTYEIDIEYPGYQFNKIVAKLNPNQPLIDDILPARYEVTGQVQMKASSSSGNNTPPPPRQHTIIAHSADDSGSDLRETILTNKDDGLFTVFLPPGDFVLKPLDDQTQRGIRLTPNEARVKIVDQPVKGLIFHQILATLRGKVSCLESPCSKNLEISLSPVVSSSSQQEGDDENLSDSDSPSLPPVITELIKGSEYTFTDIPFGKYLVSVSSSFRAEWCWVDRTHEVDVTKEQTEVPVFTQNGYLLSCHISHPAVLVARKIVKTKKKESLVEDETRYKVSSGENSICIPESGLFQLTLESCHQFEPNEARFDTSIPDPVAFKASKHLIKGSLQLSPEVLAESTIDTVVINSIDIQLRFGSVSEPEIIKALPPSDAITKQEETSKTKKESVKDETNNKNKKKLKTDRSSKSKQQEGDGGSKSQSQPKQSSTFYYEFWSRTIEVSVSPIDSKLVFHPPSQTIHILGDVCPVTVGQFLGVMGKFVTGATKPALPGAHITITDPKGAITKVQTNDQGVYKHGPFDNIDGFSVEAEMAGYLVKPSRQTTPGSYDFSVFKLAEIIIEVKDHEAPSPSGEEESSEASSVKVKVEVEVERPPQPVAEVLVSVASAAAAPAGEQKYRSNNFTGADGRLILSGLSPGEYFIKPMMKEYSFDPDQKLVQLKEGTAVKLEISATRTDYSCFGSTVSLNSEPEAGVMVEAVGQGPSCSAYQEESRTDDNGLFRIRGLKPQCIYSIHMKNVSSNSHVERSEPSHIILSMEKKDVYVHRLILFRHVTHMDISGDVLCDDQHLHSLTVLLYSLGDLERPIHKLQLADSKFFFFPSVQRNLQVTYLMRLESTLSKSLYQYELNDQRFTAERFHQHLSFIFRPKMRQPVEMDSTQSSIMLFLAFTLAGLVIFKRDMVSQFSQTLLHQLSNAARTRGGGGGDNILHVALTALQDFAANILGQRRGMGGVARHGGGGGSAAGGEHDSVDDLMTSMFPNPSKKRDRKKQKAS